jgi:hypothetical protein
MKTMANAGKQFLVLEILAKVEEGELTYGERTVSADKPERAAGDTDTGFNVFDDHS